MAITIIISSSWNQDSVINGHTYNNNDSGASLETIMQIVDEAINRTTNFADHARRSGRVTIQKGIHQKTDSHISVSTNDGFRFHILTKVQYVLVLGKESHFMPRYIFHKVVEGLPGPNPRGMIELLPDDGLPSPNKDGFVELTPNEAKKYFYSKAEPSE